MKVKEQIVKSLKNVIFLLNPKEERIEEVTLEIPERQEFGDYSSNIAMAMFAKIKAQISRPGKDDVVSADDNPVIASTSAPLGVNFTKQSLPLVPGFSSPRALAEHITEELKKDEDLMKVVFKIEIAGPGFINFYLKNDVLLNNLIQIVSKDDYGKKGIDNNRKTVVEFAHPNTHKPFHIGHLRNITTGEAIARILIFSGINVKRVNYQGDVGLHIAKALWGINKLGFSDPQDVGLRAEFLGKAYVEGNKAYESDETSKEEIHQLNKSLYEKKDGELLKLYDATRQWSLDYFEKIYQRVGTKFDRLYFESEVAEEGVKLANEALEKNILEKSEGAVIFPGSKYGLHERVFITSRGVPTYEGKDLGLAKLQFAEFDPDILIHIVGPEQIEYFKVLIKALEQIIPETTGRELHLPYGWVRLKEGKMSSRTGNVILGEWLLDQAKNKIIEKYGSDLNVAEKIAVAAVKYSFLKTALDQEIAFDLDDSIALEGNSGPYLQYTYARTQSVLRKAQDTQTVDGLQSTEEQKAVDDSLLAVSVNDEEKSLLRLLIYFPEIVESAAKNYAPNLICNYLYDLAQKFNTFYNAHKIIVDDPHVLELRLKLTSSVGTVLRSGLDLLGIDTIEKM